MNWAQRPSCRVQVAGHDTCATGRLARRLVLPANPPTPSEALLAHLLSRAIRSFPEPHFNVPLRRAAREALLLAERTGYALLLLPELFSELAIKEMLQAEYLRLGRI